MSAQHFVLWVSGERTHVATRNAYRRGEGDWRYDEALSVPVELVMVLGWEEWQTPENGPFPAFRADKLPQIALWLNEHGYTAQVLNEPPA